MKLAALGVVTALIGVALGAAGLIGIGAWWVVVGLLVRVHVQRMKDGQAAAQAAADEAAGAAGAAGVTAPSSGTSKRAPAMDGKTFAIGTVLYLVLGVPSVLVGALLIGIPPEHEAWRWLPLVVGILALGIEILSGVLYLTGSALVAVAGEEPTVPATLWIRAARETGTYINERPRLELDLRVEPDTSTELAPYEVTKKATVPFTAMGSLRVGDGFRALVAGPEDPTSMEIKWDEPVEGPGSAEDVSARLAQLEELRRTEAITDEEYQEQRDRILGSL